jgi:uncharacterized DUF497 family protein
VDVEYDDAKDAANRAKHMVPLAVGAVVIANRVADIPDPRHTTEERRLAFGTVNGRLFVCVYTMRGDVIRLISVRKANSREQRRWQR